MYRRGHIHSLLNYFHHAPEQIKRKLIKRKSWKGWLSAIMLLHPAILVSQSSSQLFFARDRLSAVAG
jgi:hypothetical protein